MDWILKVSLLVLLLVTILIARSDFKDRTVSILLLLAYSFLLATDAFMSVNLKFLFSNLAFNLVFLLLQFLLITLYLSVKNKRITFVTNGFMGWADVWIILTLALSFFWVNYILFMTVSFTLSLLIHVIFSLIKKKQNPQIPLAAYLVISYATLRYIAYFYHYDLFDQNIVLSIFQ